MLNNEPIISQTEETTVEYQGESQYRNESIFQDSKKFAGAF